MKRLFKVFMLIVLAISLALTIVSFAFSGTPFGCIEFCAIIVDIASASDPPRPSIVYGEFSFTLVYEINGDEKIIDDVLICEYDGIFTFGGITNKARSWKYSFKSGMKRITLYQDETNIVYYDLPTYPDTLMGDGISLTEWFSKDAWRLGVSDNDNSGRGYSVSEEELFEKYGIRIKSWDIDPPIENSFK